MKTVYVVTAEKWPKAGSFSGEQTEEFYFNEAKRDGRALEMLKNNQYYRSVVVKMINVQD